MQPGIELLVLEGTDTGQKFTVDSDEVVIGRRLTASELPGGIVLHDPTVSSRQAVIRQANGSFVIEHLEEATNPTLVNGTSIQSAMLVAGSQIQIGRIVIDVRNREGTALADFTQLFAPTAAAQRAPGSRSELATEAVAGQTSELALDAESGAVREEIGWVEVRENPDSDQFVRYPIRSGSTLVGRSADCDVEIDHLGVSRIHAELVWEGRDLVLYHKSKTNHTVVNRHEVTHRMVVRAGDEILLAGRVALTVEINPDYRFDTAPRRSAPVSSESAAIPAHGPLQSGLHAAMEQKLALDKHIAHEFSVEGTFMDIDVVNSTGMKTDISEPERIIVSFERFRAYVSGIVTEFDGHVLNSNGDELMCFFASSFNAVRAGSEVFSRLDLFNKDENVLDSPFRFRIGVHSGKSLVDLKRGIAYSAVLDVAGHLQKLAEPDHMTISEHTLSTLPSGLPFQFSGRLERENFDYYTLHGVID
jgi:pSer/pThr/pTyr-binding forkhead associated (FHA) protein